jgi:hypothetical protein
MKDIELLNYNLTQTILKTDSFFNSQNTSLCSSMNVSDAKETNNTKQASCENLSLKRMVHFDNSLMLINAG